MIDSIPERAGWILAAKVRMEFEKQGHRLSNKTFNSITPIVKVGIEDVDLIVAGPKHLQWVNTGRKRGKKRVPIDAIMSWMRRRNFPERGKEARSIAFAIQYSIWKNGIPSPGANKFSQNGKRTGFIQDAAIEGMAEVRQLIERELSTKFSDEWRLALAY